MKVSECRGSLVVLCNGSLSAVRRQEVKSSTADSEARWPSGRQEPSSYADVHRYSRAVQTSEPSRTCTGNANARTSLCWGRPPVLFRQTTKRFLNWQKGLKLMQVGGFADICCSQTDKWEEEYGLSRPQFSSGCRHKIFFSQWNVEEYRRYKTELVQWWDTINSHEKC